MERTKRKEVRKEKKKEVEEKQTEEKRTNEKEAKKEVTTRNLRKRNAWKSCRKESGRRSVREFSSLRGKRRTSRTFLWERLRGKPRWTPRRTEVLLPIEGRINGVWVDAYLDTDATISLVSSGFVHYEDLVPKNICGVKTGEGGVTLTEGEIEGEVQVGDRKVLQKFQAFDTDAYEAVLETDFFAQNKWIKYLSLQEPTHLLVVNEEQEWEAIPLKGTKYRRPTLKTLKSFPLALYSEV